MQQTRGTRKRGSAIDHHRISLDVTDQQDVLDRKMREAIERIERVRSKALLAVGSMLAADR
ncbi:MAG: hypothetical protein WDA27_00850 [Actinomycetota bacterium]